MLQPQDGIGEEHPDQAERQHGDGILFPRLLPVGVDPEEKVAKPFHRPQDRVQEGLALSIQNLEKVNSHRPGQRQEGPHVNTQLYPPEGVVKELHGLEPFRSKDRDEQVGDEAYPDKTDDDVHGSDPFERCDVQRAEDEKTGLDDVKYVDHNCPPWRLTGR